MNLNNTNEGIATTKDALYIIKVDTFERLAIQFIPKLSSNRTHKVGEFEVIGRNTPRYQSTGGSSGISLKLDFYADDDNRESAIAKARWLESLCGTNGYVGAASVVKLVWGKLYRNQNWVVRSAKANYDLFHPYKGLYFPVQATVDIELSLDSESNLTTNGLRHQLTAPLHYTPSKHHQRIERVPIPPVKIEPSIQFPTFNPRPNETIL